MKRWLVIVGVVLLAAWLRTAFYAVDYTEFVYVTRFGEPVAIHDGERAAGLKIKAPWPVDSVQRIDRRVQAFDLPAVESLTRDPVNRTVDKTLAVDAFVTWKIPTTDAADRFVKVVRTPEQAKKIGEQIGIKWDRFDVEQLRRGMDVELEHGQRDPRTNVTNDDPLVTGKIAWAHLNEFPDYYERLEKLEDEAEEYWAKKKK